MPTALPLCRVAACLFALFVAYAGAAPKPAPRPAELPSYAARDDAMRFAQELAQRHELDAGWVQRSLAQARQVPSVARLIMPVQSGIAKNWAAYRARFVEPSRIRAGLAFWDANAGWLAKAQALYGVPAEIIVGIVGVETIYGQQMGGFRVIDALATLAFDFPAGRSDRSGFFRDELEQLFVLCRSGACDPLALRGSYAGAMGMPQFMPSSWNRWAIDFDRDGRIDLHASAADVIGSVAHYLSEFGWVSGAPTHFETSAPADAADRAALLATDIVPAWNAEYFAERGAALSSAGRQYGRALALIELQNGDTALPSYVAGTHNFYAITRYNWSSYYAMAVIELGAAIARERAPSADPSEREPDQDLLKPEIRSSGSVSSGTSLTSSP